MSAGPRLIIYTDGAARGNPGPAGAGAHICDEEGRTIGEARRALGRATNNVAEYRALLLGLERAVALGAQSVEIRADSELLVRQMRGEYKVRNEVLRELVREAHRLAEKLHRVEYVHVRREQNAEADRLANQAIDADVRD